MSARIETKVVLSAAVEREQREALELLAREGDRTLSQQVRVAIREYLAQLTPDDEGGRDE